MVSNNLFTRTILRFKFLRQLWQPGTIYSDKRLSDIVRVVSFYIKCQPTVFIVFSYRRLSDVMCADRHWKLVYRWISAHITLLEEHPPISGSFMFFSITIIRIIRGRQKKSVEISVIRGKRKNRPVHTHEAVIYV